MVRCPLRPLGHHDSSTDADAVRHLAGLWSDPVLREAVHVASSVLAGQVEQVLAAGGSVDRRKAAAARRALLKYAIRITSRPTPFGTFGGVAMVEPGSEPLTVGELDLHRKRARLGFGPLRRIKDRWESAGEDLCVQVNPTARAARGRVTVAVNPRAGAGRTNETVSVRLGAPLAHVLDQAATPVGMGRLAESLRAAFPDVPQEMLDGFLQQLVERGVLITELALSGLDPDPLRRLRARLADPELEHLAALVEKYAATPVGGGVDALDAVCRELRTDAHAAQEHLQVDTALAVGGQVPAEVAQRAVAAVDALARTSLVPANPPELHEHAARFLDMYGQALVPLPEVLDPVTGIGTPAGYPTSPHRSRDRSPGPEMMPFLEAGRRLRARLVDRARTSGEVIVVLEPSDLAQLPAPPGRMPATYDVFVQVDTAGGELAVAISPIGVSFPAGKAHGRFAHLDAAVLDHVELMTELDERAHPGHLLVEIDYVNNRDRVNHVAAAPSVRSHRLRVTSCAGTGASLTVDDLLVGVEDGAFHLVHAADGRRVLCRRTNLVTPETGADLVRFVEEVSYCGFLRPVWTWGELEDGLDFLPGVECAGVLLTPPRWRVPEPSGGEAERLAALRQWSRGADVPDHVHVGAADNRLLLDLRDPLHLDLLAREIRAGSRFVSAALPPGRRGHARGAVDRAR